MNFAREGLLLHRHRGADRRWDALRSRSTDARGRSGSPRSLLVVVALWVAYFFRDPERTGERGERLVIAPADGKVVMITEVDEPAFMHEKAIRISIFMNVFNVHVNRYPVSGDRALRRSTTPGKFLNAAREKASLENEQTSVGIESGSNRVLVRQIAGSHRAPHRHRTRKDGRTRARRATAWASFASAHASTSSSAGDGEAAREGRRRRRSPASP